MVLDPLTVMKKRKSARAYLDKPVSRQLVEDIIRHAGLSPSAINLQPWEFVVTYGEEKERLVRRLKKVHAERNISCGPGTSNPLPEAYARRSRRASKALEPYVADLGIPFKRFIEDGSCSFYGAPIAVIVTMDRLFPAVRYLDVGMSVAYLLLAAEARGLATCPIGLITAYQEDIAEVLNLPASKEVLLAIAMGYADGASPVNAVRTDREPLEQILSWYE
jgi:nitroreductase